MIEIISSIFSDHSSMKLGINHRKKSKKQTKKLHETKKHATKKLIIQQ